MLTWLSFCKAKKKVQVISCYIVSCTCVLSYTDIDLFHIQLSIDKYWICEIYVCMTEVKEGTLQLHSHRNMYVFVLNIFVMKALFLFLNEVLHDVQ